MLRVKSQRNTSWACMHETPYGFCGRPATWFADLLGCGRFTARCKDHRHG